MTAFSVNGKQVNLDVDPSTPLLWVIRDHLGLTGTKYGCGMGSLHGKHEGWSEDTTASYVIE